MEFPDLNRPLGIRKLTNTGKQNGGRKDNQYQHGQQHRNHDQKNNRDTNAGRDEPSLNGLKMRVPLSFLITRVTQGISKNLTNVH